MLDLGRYVKQFKAVRAIRGLLPDWALALLSQDGEMITPFESAPNLVGKVSYGVSSYGYDIRLADKFQLLKQPYRGVLDCKAHDPSLYISGEGAYCDLPPYSVMLGRSVEVFKIPRNVLVTATGKSSYARLGLIVNVTPLEPGWNGVLTILLANVTPLPIRVYTNEGIAQLLFFSNDNCELSYAEKKYSKYQGQTGITYAK